MESINIDKIHKEDYSIINIDYNTNSIYFNADINSKTSSQLIEKLIILEQYILKKHKIIKRKFSDIEKEEDIEDQFVINIEPKPISLYITSNGGHVYQAFTIIDTIRGLKVPVNTICKGYVASAGTLISLTGVKRFITEYSYMLIHEITFGGWGKYSFMSDNMENSRQIMEDIKKYYLKKTKMTIEEINEQLKKDICWNAEKCLEKGLVDEIIKY